MQDAGAVEGLGVLAGAAELVVVDAALWGGALLLLVLLLWGASTSKGIGAGVFVEDAAEGFRGHGVEVGFEDSGPAGSVRLRGEVEV